MFKKIFTIISIIFVYSICCIFIYNTKASNISSLDIKTNYNRSNILGILEIKTINIRRPIYNINDSKNNVEENITILKESILPDQDNSIMFLAAHSGEGYIAYFNDLDKLKIGDEVNFYYKNKKYTYIVSSVYEEDKNGYIHVNKEDRKQLILTTCSKNKNKQLVVNTSEKKFH